VRLKSETNCRVHALIIAIAKISDDTNYKSYLDGWKLDPVIHRLRESAGINLDRGGVIRELNQFQEYFKEYRIVVFSGFNFEDTMFDEQVQKKKRINLL